MTNDNMRVCGVPDHLGDVSCKWPMLDVSVFAAGTLGGVNLADAASIAINRWNDVCGLRLRLATNSKTAHILVSQGPIDGRNGVLAQSELPCGFTATAMRQLQQTYDSNEIWVIGDNPPVGKIDLARVMCHELGHAIGIGHITDGNLMSPVYSTSIAVPRNADITEARARYGSPAPVAPPSTPAPVPATGKPQLILPSGEVWELEGRRLK